MKELLRSPTGRAALVAVGGADGPRDVRASARSSRPRTRRRLWLEAPRAGGTRPGYPPPWELPSLILRPHRRRCRPEQVHEQVLQVPLVARVDLALDQHDLPSETLFVGRCSGSTTAIVAAVRRRFDTSPARSSRLTRARGH